MFLRLLLPLAISGALHAADQKPDPHGTSQLGAMLPNTNADRIISAVKTDGMTVEVMVLSNGREIRRSFVFPAAIREFIVQPHLQGESVVIAASPLESADWFWGKADLAAVDAGAPGSVTLWHESPPHDAKLLSVETTGGDSFVIHAVHFARNFPNGNQIQAYAYVNHCPIVTGKRDAMGQLFKGDLAARTEYSLFMDKGKVFMSERGRVANPVGPFEKGDGETYRLAESGRPPLVLKKEHDVWIPAAP